MKILYKLLGVILVGWPLVALAALMVWDGHGRLIAFAYLITAIVVGTVGLGIWLLTE